MKTARERRRRFFMGCLTDCVAYCFDVHPEQVPLFVFPRRGWSRRLKAWYRRRGYRAYWIYATHADLPARGLTIVCGDSLKYARAGHVVVYRGRRLVYDPDFPSRWRHSRITHRLVVVPLERAER